MNCSECKNYDPETKICTVNKLNVTLNPDDDDLSFATRLCVFLLCLVRCDDATETIQNNQ